MEEMREMSSALSEVIKPTVAEVLETPEPSSDAAVPPNDIVESQGQDTTNVDDDVEKIRAPTPTSEPEVTDNKDPTVIAQVTAENDSKNHQEAEIAAEPSPLVDSNNQQAPKRVLEPPRDSDSNEKVVSEAVMGASLETSPQISVGPAAPAMPEPMAKPEVANKDDEYLLLLNQYLQCIRNKQAHAGFLEDAVVGPFLSLCLGSDSDKVLVGVLKIINVLLKNRENFIRLKELLHFTDALLVASRNEKLHGAIRAKAATFFEIIINAKKPLGNNDSNADASIEVGKPVSSTREVHLFINHPLQKNRRVIITRALVKIEGVISVAYNPEQQLCVVRARGVRPENLGTTVANLGLECYLIAKNEKKEVVRIQMKPDTMGAQGNDENKQEPFYFPEEDEEAAPGANAVVKKGFHENDGSETWWNSAKKLARKSLFW